MYRAPPSASTTTPLRYDARADARYTDQVGDLVGLGGAAKRVAAPATR